MASNSPSGTKGTKDGATLLSVKAPAVCLSNVSPFLAKTYALVNDSATDRILSWSPSGNSFIVHSQTQLEQQILPHYFKHGNFSSFVRQLNNYGFSKISSKAEFSAPGFTRDKPELTSMKRHDAQRHLKRQSRSSPRHKERLMPDDAGAQLVNAPNLDQHEKRIAILEHDKCLQRDVLHLFADRQHRLEGTLVNMQNSLGICMRREQLMSELLAGIASGKLNGRTPFPLGAGPAAVRQSVDQLLLSGGMGTVPQTGSPSFSATAANAAAIFPPASGANNHAGPPSAPTNSTWDPTTQALPPHFSLPVPSWDASQLPVPHLSNSVQYGPQQYPAGAGAAPIHNQQLLTLQLLHSQHPATSGAVAGSGAVGPGLPEGASPLAGVSNFHAMQATWDSEAAEELLAGWTADSSINTAAAAPPPF